MEKWEYMILNEKDYHKPGPRSQVEQMEIVLEKLGEDGWELIHFNWLHSVFKRKKKY